VKQPFADHLAELRRRLITVLALYMLIAVLSYPLAKPLLSRMKADLLPGAHLIIVDPQEAVMSYIKASLLIAFALTLPVTAYHAWAFAAPALLRDEKRLIAYLIVPSTIMFAAGAAFGYLILLPVALGFLIGEAEPLATPMLSMDAAFSFITFILLAMGLVFQLPLVCAALAKLGVLTPARLSHYRRHAIVLIFLASGIITPDPSPVTQALLAAPMMVLYELGILAAKIAGGGHARKR
jgi:sec-independent protein translocase protein TatC